MKNAKAGTANTKIKRTSLTEQVFLSMKQCIIDGTWKENDKIPSEGELAETYGVNKLTIRLALQQLNTLGIIETRVGDGSYVKKFSIFNYIDSVSDFWESVELVQDVRDFRQGVETECLRLACKNATDSDLEVLKQRLHDSEHARERLYMKKVSGGGKDDEFEELLHGVAVADYEFHAQISVMSHNSLLELSYKIAKNALIQYFLWSNQARIEFVTSRAEDFTAYVKYNSHKNIYTALEKRDLQQLIRSSYKLFDHTDT